MKNDKAYKINPIEYDYDISHSIDYNELNDTLKKYEDTWLSTGVEVLDNNGMVTTENGGIAPVNESDKAAFIPAVTLSTKCKRCTGIVNTINNGFRFVGIDKETLDTVDLGPVNTACMIGNTNRPEGLFVPFNNIDAMKTAAEFLSRLTSNMSNADSVTFRSLKKD